MTEINKLLAEFQNLPKFPDGRINYKNSKKAPVVIVFVKFKQKILLLKRSDKVSTYKEKWQTVAGYIDEEVSLKDKALEELREEIGVIEQDFSGFKFGKPYATKDQKIGKTWIVYPCLIQLRMEKEIKIDFEHTEFVWILPSQVTNYDIVPNVVESLRRVL